MRRRVLRIIYSFFRERYFDYVSNYYPNEYIAELMMGPMPVRITKPVSERVNGRVVSGELLDGLFLSAVRGRQLFSANSS